MRLRLPLNGNSEVHRAKVEREMGGVPLEVPVISNQGYRFSRVQWMKLIARIQENKSAGGGLEDYRLGLHDPNGLEFLGRQDQGQRGVQKIKNYLGKFSECLL